MSSLRIEQVSGSVESPPEGKVLFCAVQNQNDSYSSILFRINFIYFSHYASYIHCIQFGSIV